MMPEMDGIETTRIIREEIGTEYAKNIPIIALTANAIIGNEKIFLEHGFQAFISKPIDVMQLDAVVRRWLRHDVGSRGPRAEEREGPQEGVAPEESAPPGEAVAPDETVAPKGGFAHLKIDGLDVEKGLDRFGDDEATFLQVLRSYAVNTKPLLEQIRGVTESGLPGYAIIVHGIKGSSRGVCAESIGNRAEALEHAAKAGDMAFVEANNGGFIEAVEKLLDTLRAALSLVDVERPKLQKDVPDEALLEKLAECCENYDMDGIDEVMAELEKFDYTAGATGADLVVWLRERVERMELAEIRDRLLVTAA
jgi:CheY-like chemotaxis protein